MCGITIRARLARRVEFLDAALSLIAEIETRMTCFLEPLDLLLGALRTASPIMKNAPEEGFFEAWRDTFSSKSLPIRESDRDLLLSFGASLGASDLAGQRALCEETRARLRRALGDAREEKKRFSRLGAVLPAFAGAAVIILFI